MSDQEIPYCEAKDLRDINHNMQLLIVKFNHEHTNITEKISSLEKNMGTVKQNVDKINNMEKDIVIIKEMKKSDGRWLKGLLGFITALGVIISIGAMFP